MSRAHDVAEQRAPPVFVVLVEFEVHDRHAADFLRRVRQQARDSLAKEPHCHVFDVCVDPQHHGRVVLYEIYTDPAAFDLHLQSEHFRLFDAEVAAWVTSKKVRVLERQRPLP